MAFAFFALLAASALPSPPTPSMPEFKTTEESCEEAGEVAAGKRSAPSQPVASRSGTPSVKELAKDFTSFTGKVTGSRVRVRLQPSLEGAILKELNQGSLVVATGEVDGFYAIRPEKNRKGYVYRTYVLDGIVEASNVNIRLEPDIHAPVVGQLQQGEKVGGEVYAENPKWLSIELPDSIRWYISREYVASVGDPTFFQRVQNRREQVATRLLSLAESIKSELKKPFSEIQLVPFVNDLKAIVAQNQDLPELVDRALELVKTVQDQYLQLSQGSRIAHDRLVLAVAHNQVAHAEALPEMRATAPKAADVPAHHISSFSLEQQESSIVEEAVRAGKHPNEDAFYAAEVESAQELFGQVIPYERPVKNRPGDFMLVDTKTKVPTAYIYSTKLDLSPLSGKTIRFRAKGRPNHRFALPAYFVLSVAE